MTYLCYLDQHRLLAAMETPKTLNDHFAVVDDFFQKTFRDDCQFFMRLKTTQFASSVRTTEVVPAQATTPSTGAAVVRVAAEDAARNPNFFSLSPRLKFFTNGEALGKLKLMCGVSFPNVCRLQQSVVLSSDGVVSGKIDAFNLYQGLNVGGHVVVNTIGSPGNDRTSLSAFYTRSNLFSTTRFHRNGLGSSELLADFGARFLNLMVAAGFSRQKLSFVEQQTGAEEEHSMSYGAGYTGVNWSIGGKCIHTNGFWKRNRIALIQKLKPSTTVACEYDLDIQKSKALVTIGFSQGIHLRLPYFLQPSNSPLFTAPNNSSVILPPTIASVPFVVACKGSSDGVLSGTIRTIFNGSLRMGIVAQSNLKHSQRPQMGFSISLEDGAM